MARTRPSKSESLGMSEHTTDQQRCNNTNKRILVLSALQRSPLQTFPVDFPLLCMLFLIFQFFCQKNRIVQCFGAPALDQLTSPQAPTSYLYHAGEANSFSDTQFLQLSDPRDSMGARKRCTSLPSCPQLNTCTPHIPHCSKRVCIQFHMSSSQGTFRAFTLPMFPITD